MRKLCDHFMNCCIVHQNGIFHSGTIFMEVNRQIDHYGSEDLPSHVGIWLPIKLVLVIFQIAILEMNSQWFPGHEVQSVTCRSQSELNRHGCLQSVCVYEMSAIWWIRVVYVCSVSEFFENAVVRVCFASALFQMALSVSLTCLRFEIIPMSKLYLSLINSGIN